MSERCGSGLAATLVAALFAVVMHAGCGGAAGYRSDEVEMERDDPAGLDLEQEAREEELAEALARPEVDCGSVCELGEVICDLTTRICDISERNPGDERTRARCTDSTGRCESARERIAAHCACEE